MATPSRDNSTGQSLLAVLREVFVAFPASFRLLLLCVILWHLGVLWALANFRKTIQAPGLLDVSRVV